MKMTYRGKSWVVMTAVLMLVLLFLAVSITYSATHVEDRYRQLPAGATTSNESVTYKILEVRQAPLLSDPGDDPQPAGPGSVWVIATIEIVMPVIPEFVNCSLNAVGAGNRTWAAKSIYSNKRPLPTSCDGELIKPDVPYIYEGVYEIPERYADGIYGFYVNNPMRSEPNEVISP